MSSNLLEGLENLDYTKVIDSFMKKSCIIDFGIVQEVVAKGIVNISLSVASTEQDIVCMTCVLANIASNGFTLDITPEVGDKVIVFYPRRFDESMFTIADSDSDKTKTIINSDVRGYNLFSGIAFLFNQFQSSAHKNILKIEEGKINFTIAYNKDEDKNYLSVETTDKGAVTIKNDKTTIEIKDDGNLSVDNGKATVTVSDSGDVTIDTKGKYEIKNSSTSLKDVIDGVAKELENLTTTGSPATQATSPASKATITTWRTSKLNTFFN